VRHDVIDRWSRLESPVHRLPAGVKLGAALALVLATVTRSPGQWTALAAVALVLGAVAGLSRVPVRFLAGRLLLLEPLALGVAGLALFQPDGLRIFATLLAKTTLCLLTMLLLSSTTPFADLLAVMRRARVPALLVSTLALMYRYVFVLADETHRMRRARASRTFRRGRWWTWRTLATVIGQLFIRSTERAERIHAAMTARGWR
jgi:cobalt/nickel transport system permease protein